MKRPLPSRLREIRDRMDLLGDDEDVATLNEALRLAERDEREQAEAAQTALPIDAPTNAPTSAQVSAHPAAVAVHRDPDEPRLGPFAGGSKTSRQAAVRAYPKQGTQRHSILDALAEAARSRLRGFTRDELAEHLSLSPNTIRPRIVELMDDRFVEDSGRVRPTAAGLDAEVLVVTDAGRQALAEAPV